jgi:hypothetical protein
MEKFLRQLVVAYLVMLCSHVAFAAGDYKLIFALDLIRHGDRAPSYYIPAISNAWTKEEIGKLTPLGVKNSELLGNQLRKYYVDKEQLLPKRYNSHLMQVRATYVKRTQDTAQYILHGFYPEDYASVQIQVAPKNKDTLLRSQHQHPEEKKAILKTAEEKFLNDKGYPYRDARIALVKLNAVFGTKFASWFNLTSFCDISRVSKIHDKPLLKPITTDNLESICKDSVKMLWAHFENDVRTRCLYAKPFMLHVAEVIQKQSAGHGKARYALYVAHDTNIVASALLMGKLLDGTPPYLSDLRFELFKHSKSGVNFVRASLNGEPIKICASGAMCPATEFVSTLRSIVENQCSYESMQTSLVTFHGGGIATSES